MSQIFYELIWKTLFQKTTEVERNTISTNISQIYSQSLPSPTTTIESLTREFEHSLDIHSATKGQYVVKPQVRTAISYHENWCKGGKFLHPTGCQLDFLLPRAVTSSVVQKLRIQQITKLIYSNEIQKNLIS